MKKTRFSEEQMVTILREADTKPVPDVAKKHGVSARRSIAGGSTFAAWNRPTSSACASLSRKTVQLSSRPSPCLR